MRKFWILALVLASVTSVAFAQVKVSGASAKLGDLVGSPTLVTVVLKTGHRDANLKVSAGPQHPPQP